MDDSMVIAQSVHGVVVSFSVNIVEELCDVAHKLSYCAL